MSGEEFAQWSLCRGLPAGLCAGDLAVGTRTTFSESFRAASEKALTLVAHGPGRHAVDSTGSVCLAHFGMLPSTLQVERGS